MTSRETSAQVLRNRRFAVLFLAAVLVLTLSWLLRPRLHDTVTSPGSLLSPSVSASSSAPSGPTSAQTRLAKATRIAGKITPKSITAASTGVVLAANMMYGHNVTLYAADGTAQATIADGVDAARLGASGPTGTVRGAPVEAVFTADGQYAYVTNYAMYGAGLPPEPSETCTPADQVAPSYVYRIDLTKRVVDQVMKVGGLPKSLAITPDGRSVVVANWCSWDLSVIDTAQGKPVATVRLDKYPLGLAVSPDSRTVYVGLSGVNKLVTVDLGSVAGGVTQAQDFAKTDADPRDIAISPDGRYLYLVHNEAGTVTKLDSSSGAVVAQAKTNEQPRSLVISPDGSAVYVANYATSTLVKLRGSDLGLIEEVKTDVHPVGVTYEPTKKRVWVACYSGSIVVFDDSTVPAAAPVSPASSSPPPASSPASSAPVATSTASASPRPSTASATPQPSSPKPAASAAQPPTRAAAPTH